MKKPSNTTQISTYIHTYIHTYTCVCNARMQITSCLSLHHRQSKYLEIPPKVPWQTSLENFQTGSPEEFHLCCGRETSRETSAVFDHFHQLEYSKNWTLVSLNVLETEHY